MQAYANDGTRLERTGWRCQDISKRHRKWGYNCPAVDLDFVVAEYNHGKPVALVEYKERHAQRPKVEHPTYKALSDLANGYSGGELPFFVAFYDAQHWWFEVLPINEASRKHYAHCIGETLTERRFVTSLYRLRKKVLDDNDKAAIEQLNNILPEQVNDATAPG